MKMLSHLLRRRSVHIVAENCKSATCSLHRLNVSEHLFYPSTAEAEANQAAKQAAISTLESLPERMFSFQREPRLRSWDQLFTLVNPRSSESKILWSGREGSTLLLDADALCSHAMPSIAYTGSKPIAISIPRPDADAPEEEDLYVLSSNMAFPSFQVLTFGFGGRKSSFRPSYEKKQRQWESLPPPPLPLDFGIRSHTVLDDGVTICVTATSTDFVDYEAVETVLTCLFDTVKREWRQATGRHWDLPFEGGAEYIPDLKLWLGLSRDEHQLCAYDLLSAAAAGEPQTLKHLGQVVEMPKEWESINAGLLNLGEWRFCIAKIIQEASSAEEADHPLMSGRFRMLALLTGVEMVPGEEGFKIVTHKSLSYIFNNYRIRWVL